MAALLGFAGSVAAQGLRAESYSDPNTGIDFQRYQKGSYSFGITVPETMGSDFIGQMVIPTTDGEGWGAVSLKGGMLNGLLFVAWADGDEVITTFRVAGSYANPDVYSDTEVSALPITNGTFINSTHISYTFVCEGCIVEKMTSITNESPVLGWAIADTNPTTPSDPGSALSYHAAGFGQFGVDIEAAKSAKYAQWASWASAPTPGTGNGGGSNGTVPGNGTTVPPTTSN
ncbi:hypothetical protein FZEAL_8899, partial [Fusarium zealandicum]